MVRITVIVSDIESVLLVYNQVRIYSSSSEAGTYTLLTSLALQSGVSEYNYTDLSGTPDTWYKSSYYNSVTFAESGLSNSAHGVRVMLYHTPTYPDEIDLDYPDLVKVRKIRRLIGDLEKLKRIYSDDASFCTSIMDDNHTIDMGEKGWPVYVSVDNVEYTTLDDPVVQGYRYLTFSGTLAVGSTNPDINIWFTTFKFSDREVYEAYGDTLIPPGLTTTTVTEDHLILQAAIDLLENMTSEDMVDDGAVIRDDQTLYDPSPGLRERDKTLKRIRKMLDALVKQYMFSGLTGLLVD